MSLWDKTETGQNGGIQDTFMQKFPPTKHEFTLDKSVRLYLIYCSRISLQTKFALEYIIQKPQTAFC